VRSSSEALKGKARQGKATERQTASTTTHGYVAHGKMALSRAEERKQVNACGGQFKGLLEANQRCEEITTQQGKAGREVCKVDSLAAVD
jgi:hypothetical protein